jgi:serine protease Do
VNDESLIIEGNDRKDDSYSLTADVGEHRQNAITRTVAAASDAIVGINVTDYKRTYAFSKRDGWGRWRDIYRKRAVKGLGSGFIVSEDGFILTNHHVAGEAEEIIITMTDGSTHKARVVGSDRVTDIALLKIDAETKLPYLKFADMQDIIVGEWTIAFGNPFGLFETNSKPTVTVGVVSNYDVNFIHEEDNELIVYRDMIQTDAAISSGNSGGPLLNADGRVIGMNTTIYSTSNSRMGSGSIGIGFAIPAHRILKIVDLIRSGKTIDRDFITGMRVRELDYEIKDLLEVEETTRGVVVSTIYRDTPAYYAGLRAGDIITSIDGTTILKAEDYNVIIFDGIVGDELPMSVIRDGKTINLKLRLTK